MENNDKIQNKINELQAKIAWCKQVGEDAANLKYWDVARFVRNAGSLADSELRGIKLFLE
jgi:hypothetical protein